MRAAVQSWQVQRMVTVAIVVEEVEIVETKELGFEINSLE